MPYLEKLLHLLVTLLLINHGCSPKSTVIADASEMQNTKKGGYEVTFRENFNDRRERGECHEDGAQFPIHDVDTWNSHLLIDTIRPVDYVVIHQHGPNCRGPRRFCSAISSQYNTRGDDTYCSFRDNFYIIETGDVVEGRGWDTAPFSYLNGLRENSVTVNFLSFGDKAKQAFTTLLKVGVWQGNLSKRHRIVFLGQIYKNSNVDKYNILNFTRKLKSWSDDISLMSTWELVPQMKLTLVSREEWGAADPTRVMKTTWSPLEYVIITEGGDRCYTPEECGAALKAEQAIYGPKFGDLTENFYIGEDSHVYEGLGFNAVPFWHVRGLGHKVMTVRLFGSFQNDQPSPRAIGALKILIETGVWMGKISKGYKLYSMREVYDDREWLGDAIFKQAKGWNRWAGHLGALSLQKRLKSGLLPLLSRTEWEKRVGNWTVDEPAVPASYVIIGNEAGFHRCYTLEECKTQLQDASIRDAVKENFYIGDDGNCYEGKGWSSGTEPPNEQFNGTAISVEFIGAGKGEVPSKPAISALKTLLRLGIQLRYLSPVYQMYYLMHVFDDGSEVGEDLYQPIESIDKITAHIESTPVIIV